MHPKQLSRKLHARLSGDYVPASWGNTVILRGAMHGG